MNHDGRKYHGSFNAKRMAKHSVGNETASSFELWKYFAHFVTETALESHYFCLVTLCAVAHL